MMLYVNVMVTIEAISIYNTQREKEGNLYVALLLKNQLEINNKIKSKDSQCQGIRPRNHKASR